ncbi:MAG: transcriptional regulator, MarR family [Rhodoglobus sp.]|nr:transcriptional regulator, MarR family [Rhodoglobus sp.]
MSAGNDVPGRLALSIGRLSRRLRAAGGGLSHGLLSALATIGKQGPIRLADLAQRELVSAPSATRLVTELEARGLVSRAVDPADGRAFLIEATEAGIETIIQARSARAELVADLFGQLDRADAAALAAALPALEAMAAEPWPPER